jgi:hypothetical protein
MKGASERGVRAGDTLPQRLLLTCLHRDIARSDPASLAALDEIGWQAMLSLAKVHGVRPLLYQRLVDIGLQPRVPSNVWSALALAARQAAARTLRAQTELAALAASLAAENIPVIALKGGYLAPQVYASPALREMSDLDLLVRRIDLRRAADVVLSKGYAPVRPFQAENDAAVSHHVTRLVKAGAFGVEIHWSVTKPHQVYSIDPAPLWQSAVTVDIAGARMHALVPEHLLLHLCLHVSYQHWFEFGLRPLCDIATTIERFGTQFDWRLFEREARAWKWTRGVQLALRLAQDMVGASVPGDVIGSFAAEDHDVVQAARAQVFLAQPKPEESHDFSRLWTVPGFRAKARLLWQRLTPPRSDIAPGGTRAPGWAFAYLRRTVTLALKYGGPALRLLGREREITAVAERRECLRVWLLEM